MRREVFDTVAWGDVVEALKERSKMFKMWYTKQGSGFCGVGYWASKWEKQIRQRNQRSLKFPNAQAAT